MKCRCFKPPLCTMKAKLGKGQPGLMRWTFYETCHRIVLISRTSTLRSSVLPLDHGSSRMSGGVVNFYILFVLPAVSKKLATLAKQKHCQVLHPWLRSISNHLYWCASSSPPGDGSLIVAKWKSIVNHIANIHHGHGEPFDSCLHGTLEGHDAARQWIDPGEISVLKIGLQQLVQRPVFQLYAYCEILFPASMAHS